ncbi:MAG: polysaccharide deacetylase family protein [Bacteroidota bacterium]
MTQVSLIFDDGFEKSCLRIAEIFENKRLSASFAVLVDSSDIYPGTPKGDFTLWNTLQERGHIIQPHGYDHTDLTKVPFETAKKKIDACLHHFSLSLSGFEASQTIYHLTYNKSTPEVDAYLLSQVRAIRSTGEKGEPGTGMNTDKQLSRKIYDCAWHGPDPCDEHLLETLKKGEKEEPQVLMYMLHGLEDEGWGPILPATLEQALNYINESPVLEYVDAGRLE